MTDASPSAPPSAAAEPSMPRRRLLYGAVAGTAAIAGAGLWQWRQRGVAQDAPTQAFWAMQFASPGGAPLRMDSFAGRPLLLNFWATWCPPCIEEMPLLDAFFREHRSTGWQVLGLAADQEVPVRRFVERQPVTFPLALAGLEGINLSKSFGNLGGGLPFTVVLGENGTVLARKIGRVLPEELLRWGSLR